MEYLRSAPTGIDSVIDRFQRALFKDLLVNAGWTDHDIYPRIYRNKKGSEVIPEYYSGTGDYKEVRFNDKKVVVSFFLTDEKRDFNEKNGIWAQGVSIIFQARLDKLYKPVGSDTSKKDVCGKERQDEKLIADVHRSLTRIGYDKYIQEVVTRIDNVYNTLKINYDRKAFDDMGDYSIARFNLKILYTNALKAQRI